MELILENKNMGGFISSRVMRLCHILLVMSYALGRLSLLLGQKRSIFDHLERLARRKCWVTEWQRLKKYWQ
jgi:hypothetical protein